MCFQIKREEVIKEAQLLVEEKPVAVPMKIFYTTGLSSEMESRCTLTSKKLREAIQKLEE
jgi:hypothetical protein